MTLLSTNWLNKIHFIAQLVLHEYNIQQNQLNVQCKNIHPTDSAMGSRLGFGVPAPHCNNVLHYPWSLSCQG